MRAITRATLNFLQRIRSRSIDEKELRASAVVFAPHQDDETLGCGGTIVRKIEAGADVSVVFLTDGSGSHPGRMAGEELANTRAAEALAATKMLGIAEQNVVFIGARDGELTDHAATVMPALQSILAERRPEQIFVPYARDRLPDHVATNALVLDAARLASNPVTVFEYPVWFWNHWPWMRQTTGSTAGRIRQFARESLAILSDFNLRVPICRVKATKRAALDCHRTQMTNFDGSGEWPTLGDVADGDFLRCLLRDDELFHRWSLS
ncbi:MAG: PIG-L family deacetylase [Proteobacteria bacterium]|nr:MAG: PIG-L family deacetylase [Pseudomonadota bacterium]